jgi:hypothetical protein
MAQSAVSELLEAVRAGDGVDLIRESVRMVLQELIETEAATVIGAARYERTRAAGDRAQRCAVAVAGHPGRRHRAAYPETAQGVVLPRDPGAEAAHRPGAVPSITSMICSSCPSGGGPGIPGPRRHPRTASRIASTCSRVRAIVSEAACEGGRCHAPGSREVRHSARPARTPG